MANPRYTYLANCDHNGHPLPPHLPPLPSPRHPSPLKTLRILALGLPRSGTDSLRSALLTLGYAPICHGFEMPISRSTEPRLWVPLLRAKLDNNNTPAQTMDWDVMLGNCDVLMDMPPCIFAEELLEYYPDAQVILNRRRDMDAWHASLSTAVESVLGSWIVWGCSWFDAELFWWMWTSVLCIRIMGRGGSFRENGRAWGEEYYRRLEGELKRDGREYLDWEVREGWGPLCEFLGKEVPGAEFPWGNRSGGEFEKNVERAMGSKIRRSLLRMGAVVAVVVGVATVGVWRIR
ncbi:hypothetical protein OHC33_009877 [Knufia fluminis]|uniref:NAD dependent epimerase/dehydratase n=1 Tax=Knufia fluminis TaxID=191047 RepID=A0AAN8EZZ1_9EURO|nr:hypothetical protein OHC33_009877 [Knufia fluminis]